jgi:hypothetical protein
MTSTPEARARKVLGFGKRGFDLCDVSHLLERLCNKSDCERTDGNRRKRDRIGARQATIHVLAALKHPQTPLRLALKVVWPRAGHCVSFGN